MNNDLKTKSQLRKTFRFVTCVCCSNVIFNRCHAPNKTKPRSRLDTLREVLRPRNSTDQQQSSHTEPKRGLDHCYQTCTLLRHADKTHAEQEGMIQLFIVFIFYSRLRTLIDIIVARRLAHNWIYFEIFCETRKPDGLQNIMISTTWFVVNTPVSGYYTCTPKSTQTYAVFTPRASPHIHFSKCSIRPNFFYYYYHYFFIFCLFIRFYIICDYNNWILRKKLRSLRTHYIVRCTHIVFKQNNTSISLKKGGYQYALTPESPNYPRRWPSPLCSGRDIQPSRI